MNGHRDQGGCENFDGEPHTIAECRAMAARINRVIDWPNENHAGDEHGSRPHYHVGSSNRVPVFFFTGEKREDES